jgi:AcrR family transcriptional regulator
MIPARVAAGAGGVAERGSARRERVMEAVIEVIAERGLASTRISDIAERAGMSAGHVLYYFGSRDRILMDALRHVEDLMHEEAGTALAEEPAGPDRLRRLLELNLPEGLATPGWTLWLEAWTLAPHNEEVRLLVTELEARWVGLLADVVRSGVDAGAFACEDVGTATTELYAMINGLAVQVVTGSSGMTRDEALEICLRFASHLRRTDG